MNDARRTGPEEQFEEVWKAWLEKPMRQQPGPDWLTGARHQRSRRFQRLWLPLAAAAALVLVFAVFFRPESPRPEIAGTVVESPTMGQGEVLIWLDEKTPLYMTFQTQ